MSVATLIFSGTHHSFGSFLPVRTFKAGLVGIKHATETSEQSFVQALKVCSEVGKFW